jgi:hypothetical protein
MSDEVGKSILDQDIDVVNDLALRVAEFEFELDALLARVREAEDSLHNYPRSTWEVAEKLLVEERAAFTLKYRPQGHAEK